MIEMLLKMPLVSYSDIEVVQSMSGIGKIIRSIIIMGITSCISLLVVSLLTYWLHWQADTAMLGITVTYILSGFLGGCSLRWKHLLKKKQNMEKVGVLTEISNLTGKLQEAILVGTLFMGILLLLSVLYIGSDFSVSTRLLTVWLLLIGSASLGRVLS